MDTYRNQNLVGKLVFWVHFLSSNNPRKTSQECFGALKSDEIMRTTIFGIKHLVSDLSDEDTGAQSQVLMALSLIQTSYIPQLLMVVQIKRKTSKPALLRVRLSKSCKSDIRFNKNAMYIIFVRKAMNNKC